MEAKEVRLIHKGEYLSYYEIDYVDNSSKKTYEMVSKTGNNFSNTEPLSIDTIGKNSVAIILVILNKTHDKMLLSCEFRMGVNRYVYNDIAGLIDDGETEEEAAARELWEETGLKLVKIIDKLNPTFTCAPVTDDVTTLFIVEAEGELRDSISKFEEIKSKWCTKEEVIELLNDKDIIFAGRMQAFAYMWAHGITN